MLLYVEEPDYSWSYSDTSCISVYYPCLFLIQGLFHSHWSAVLWWQFCTQQFDLHHQLVLSVLDVSLVGFVNQIHFLWCLSVLMTWNSMSWLVEWCVVGGRDGWCESERKWWKIEQDYLCHFNVVGVSDIWKSGVPTTHFRSVKMRGHYYETTINCPDFLVFGPAHYSSTYTTVTRIQESASQPQPTQILACLILGVLAPNCSKLDIKPLWSVLAPQFWRNRQQIWPHILHI